MAKTTVANIIPKIKRRADYNIADTDLDNLIIDSINDGLKLMKQWFVDEAMHDEIGVEGTITTTANQEYVDIATQVPELDEIIMHTERTNDRHIEMIPFQRYRKLYPDPTANTASSPDVAARWFNRIYFGPTPSQVLTMYFDYIKLIADITSTSTLPFEAKYDPLVIAIARGELIEWLDSRNATGISAARTKIADIKYELITGAAKHIGMNRQTESRRGEGYLGPREQQTSPVYGFGMGGYGLGGYGTGT